MPKQCPSCQQMLDEGASFCPICGAPVGHIEPVPVPVNAPLGESASPMGGPTSVGDSSSNVSLPPPFPATADPELTKPALMAGVLLGVLSAMPILNLCCLLWVGGAGVLAVYFLRTETPGVISAGTGATLGLLTGLFGSLVWQILETLLSYIFGPQDVRQAREALSKIENLPPEMLEAFEQAIEWFSDPFDPLFILVFLMLKLILCGILTTLGGVLGASLFGRDRKNR